ncbi:unnamed protein product [Citrullus colocynthis]|uniref:Uncharacterized protein n=1 Tax=Citrullus colocynthis TaxID=252529 RepID=A0ABP0XYV2_9ROSI
MSMHLQFRSKTETSLAPLSYLTSKQTGGRDGRRQVTRHCSSEYSSRPDYIVPAESTYRDYKGLKKLPFTSVVQQTLNSLDGSQPKSIKSSQFALYPSEKRQLEPSKSGNTDCGLPKRRNHKRVDDLSSSSYSSSYSDDRNVSEDASSEEKN